MEANVFKTRLMEAKKDLEYVKILFQYPASNHAVVKRGYVIDCGDNGFIFLEDRDGEVSYAYSFIVEVVGELK